MFKQSKYIGIGAVCIAASVALLLSVPSTAMPIPQDDSKNESEKPKQESGFAAVDNMHHFMEYINEPVYESLKAAIEDGPPAKKNWGKIKSSSLILAETSILLANRTDFKAEASWRATSLQLHQTGKALYQAARKKNLELTQKHFAEMTKSCSKCHEEYR